MIESRGAQFVPNVLLPIKQSQQDWRESLNSLAPSSLSFEPVVPLTVMDKEFLSLDHFLQKQPKEEARLNQ